MKRSGKLANQEVIQRLIEGTWWAHHFYNSPREAGRDLWKRGLMGAFFAGPFVALFGIMAAWRLAPHLIPIFLGLNAMCCCTPPLGFQLYFEKQAQWRDCVSFWKFILLGWVAFFGSVMFLFGIVGTFSWHKYPGWEAIVAGYLTAGLGIGWGRRRILRAIAEPEGHSWFRPVRLLLGLSVGSGILFSSLLRIVLNVLDTTIRPAFSFMIAMILALNLSLLLLGSALVAWSIAYLYYQRWRGAEELKL